MNDSYERNRIRSREGSHLPEARKVTTRLKLELVNNVA